MKRNILLVSFLLIFGIIGGISLMAEPDCQDCKTVEPREYGSYYQEYTDGACYDENKICFFTTDCTSGVDVCYTADRCHESFCTFVAFNPY